MEVGSRIDLPCLETLTVGDPKKKSYNFKHAASLHLKELPKLTTVVIGAFSFRYASRTCFEGTPLALRGC